MTAADYPECEKRLLAHEGGYSNIAADPGGPTNWGITIFDARKYWKPNATADDVRAMPKSVAVDIYRTKYWAATRCDDLPAGVDDTIFDYGVNSGIARSGKVLRRVLGLTDNEWQVSDEVLAAVAKRSPKDIIVAVNDERLRFLQSLSTWPTFGNGWGRRVAEVKTFSLQLAGGSAANVPLPKPAGGGKGNHPAPNHGPVIAGGATVAVGSGGLLHWLGAHPVGTAILIGVILVVVAVVVQHLNDLHKAKNETPMPGTPVVPVLPPVIAPPVAAPTPVIVKPPENSSRP